MYGEYTYRCWGVKDLLPYDFPGFPPLPPLQYGNYYMLQYVKREEQKFKVGGNYEFFFILKKNSVSQNKKSGLILSFRLVMHCSFPQIEVVTAFPQKGTCYVNFVQLMGHYTQ